jgi:hypothetical protein
VRQDGGHGLIGPTGVLLTLLAAAPSSAATPQSAALPTVSADLDGDGSVETATASSARGGIRVEVRDGRGRRIADARAPAPPGDVVPFTLTTAPIGSAGALLEVSAATDSSECVSIWRLRGRALSRVPILDAAGKPLPDCAPPAGWTWRWEAQPGRPSELVRERTETVAAGSLTSREAYAFAGFSLERVSARSGGEINGIPIPSWFPETLLTRSALETLYARFGLEAMRREPELRIETDAGHGVFALRFRVGERELVASVDAGSFSAGEATLSARAGDRTAHAVVRLAGSERNVPMEVRIEGLGAPYDQLYQPAGAWRGGARQVFQTPADELASEQLAGIWSSPGGQTTTLAVEGQSPFRIRSGATLYVPDVAAASPPADLLLRPASGAGTGWAVTLRGPNAMDRVPCRFEPGQASCAPAGPAETLRRLGARVNVR